MTSSPGHTPRPISEVVAAVWRGWKAPSSTTAIDAIAISPSYRTEEGREVPRTAHLSVRYGRLLHFLVKEFQPARLLEIGMATGVSSTYMALARQSYGGGRHVIVDPFQTADWGGGGRALLESLGLMGGVEVIEETSLRALTRMEAAGERCDFVFIDGNHCLDYTLADILLADLVLAIGGIIVLDDATGFGVADSVRYLDGHRPNLERVRLDPPLVHWFRELTGRRRRLAVYRKVCDDARGANSY